MDKKYIHKIFKGFITTVRNEKVIICLGYIDAPENFKKWTSEEEEKALKICAANGIDAKKEIKTEYGKKLVRLTFYL